MEQGEPEVDIAKELESLIPYWRKPSTPDEWGKLVLQKWSFAESAKETHESCKEIDAPLLLRQLAAKSRYRSAKRFLRTKKRAAHEKQLLSINLLRVLFPERVKHELH